MDRERLLAFFQTHYLSRREVLNKLPLSMDAESFWKELQNRRRGSAVMLPLYNAEEKPYWYCLTDRMIAASERLSEEAIGGTDSPDPYRMQMTGAMTEEMYFTSFVEGAQIPIQEAMDFLQRGTEPESIQEQLIWNNCQAWSMLVGSLYRPLDEEFVKTLAYILTQEMDDMAEDYRSADTHEIAAMQGEPYTLPRAYMIPARMGEFYEFLRNGEIHPLIKASAGQAFVLAVRPFPEGNERLARMISSAVLLRSGYDFFADISVSCMIAREGYLYYKAMKDILNPGNGADLTYFMEYYLDMLVRAIDGNRERERLREQQRKEAERRSLEQERELAKQPLTFPGSTEKAEPQEDEPGNPPEDDESLHTERVKCVDWDGDQILSEETLAVIAAGVRGTIQEMSLKESMDAEMAAELITAMMRHGLRVFTWDDIREIGPVPINAVSKVLKKLAKAGYIKNVGPNNPRARYRIMTPVYVPEIQPVTFPTDAGEVKQEAADCENNEICGRTSQLIQEAIAELSEKPMAVSEQRIVNFFTMKLAKGESTFTKAEWTEIANIEGTAAEEDLTRAVDYGLAIPKRSGQGRAVLFTIPAFRIDSPVMTDFPESLKRLLTELYQQFGTEVFLSAKFRQLIKNTENKRGCRNIDRLVRRGMIEKKVISRFVSEYRLIVDPESHPALFITSEEETVHPASRYSGAPSYAGPAVSYAAAGV